jgi:hypothetical protein
MIPARPEQIFYNDCPPEVAAEAASRLQPQLSQRADDVRRMDTSHSPFLSRPDEVVSLIAGLAG